MKVVKTILVILLVLLVVMQFFQPDLNKAEMVPATDLIVANNVPTEVANTLHQACYDCHSNNTEYPWYFRVAPVSYWMADHIKDGQNHLNFSEFENYSPKRKLHKLDKVSQALTEGWMPLDSYQWMHPEGKLTPEQAKAVIDWVDQYTVAHQIKDLPQ